MALIACPECGRQVSDRAASCPQCGCPLNREPSGPAAPRAPQQEAVLWTAHPSLFRGAPGGTLVLALVALAGVVLLVAVPPLAIVLVLLALLWVFARWIWCMATSLTITTARTTLRQGILSTHSTEVRHADVRVVEVHQELLQRVFSSGTLRIGSAGTGGMEIQVSGIPDPHKAAALIRERQGT